MNDFELDKIGNVDLRMLSSQDGRRRSPSPQKKDQQSQSKVLHLQSNIGNNFFMCGHSKQQHEAHGKCTKMTKTKWDKFSPYSFHKLTNQQKDETFLQLYEDYRGTKAKLNEEVHKNRRLQTELHRLEAEIGRLRTSGVNPGERYKVDKERNQETAGLRQEIKRLHEKIVALTGTKHKFSSRPKTANKPQQKAIIPVNENIRAELQEQRKHVRQLLLIIDQLKKNKFQVQQQLKSKQAGQALAASQLRNPNPSSLNQRNKSKLLGLPNSESQFHEYANDLHTWKQKYSDLEQMYTQMNNDKDKKIRELSAELVTVKENQRMRERVERRGGSGTGDGGQIGRLEGRVREAVMEKERLEDELRKLVQMPFYRDNKQVVDAQQKIRSLQQKLQKLKQQFTKISESNTKLISQLQFKTKQSALAKTQNEKIKKQLKEFIDKEHARAGQKGMKMDIDYDDYYRKMLALVKLEGDDPVWKKFQAIAKPEIALMDVEQAKACAQKLWHSKIELLSYLQKSQIQLTTLKQNLDSRIALHTRANESLEQQLLQTRAKLDQWKCMDNINRNKVYKVYEQAGVNYDDSVSVFDVEDGEREIRELEGMGNYFDFYLGVLCVDQGVLMRNPQNKIKNTSHFVSFLTIDFYNHETQHSNFAQGVMKKLGNNYSFKVQVNSYFLKFLSKNTITLQLWSPQGTATVLLGKGEIYLSQLINKAVPEISNVVRGKCQIYYEKKTLIATVEYRFRMRLPIFSFIQWAESKQEFRVGQARDPFLMGKKRIMEITVQRAEGLPPTINSFVYFSLQDQDFFTQPQRGPNPVYNFTQQIPVQLDQQFTTDLKQKYFKFTIFDDQKQVNQDVYGIAQANFTPILEQVDALELVVDVQGLDGEKKGKLRVGVKWVLF